MGFTRSYDVTVTTAADQTGTGYTAENIHGRVLAVKYAKVDFADTVDFTITSELTTQNIWVESNVTANKTVYPRVACHDTVGVAAEVATGFAVRDTVPLANERVKIAVAQGGIVKSGTFTIIVE